MGTIKIYSGYSSPALYSVTIDGHTLVFATYCRPQGKSEPTDKPIGSSSTSAYVKANASTMNIDTSGVMVSIAKYVVDKVIETVVTALINKFFPW